uniref:G-protein coupled receptors family 1 profile domain-containing protein n=1 Tax=Panagrolaimus sp. JU765 TaxID=591449 RepID=A0AC34QKR1_9BILA
MFANYSGLNETDEIVVLDEGLQHCNICLGSTDPKYLTYNMAVSGVLMAVFGMIGLIGNMFVVMTYTSKKQRISSTSLYLAALGASDFGLILTAMFLFVLEAWRHHGHYSLAYLYGRGAPCIENNGEESLQICPTDIRMDPIYYTVYYTYMYTTFLAVGPLLLLIVLNVCVVATVFMKKNDDNEGESDTISLILVVFMFIFCNFTALLINFLELTLYEQLKGTLVYLVDMSNFLIVINGSCNFFIYLIFGKSFRQSFFELIGKSSPPEKTPQILKEPTVIWDDVENPDCIVKEGTIIWDDDEATECAISLTPLTMNGRHS